MQKFTKAERLCSKVLIDILLEKGNSFQCFPFKLTWVATQESEVPAQIMISVPKRSFKKAIDRNKLKRRIREAYRKNKVTLHEHLDNKKVLLMFIYTAKALLNYQEIEKGMKTSLELLNKKI